MTIMFKFDDSIKRLSKESLGHVGEEGLVWVRSYDLSRASGSFTVQLGVPLPAHEEMA